MKLTDKEQEMLAGKAGPAVKWAMEHQLQVGRMFDAEEMVTVRLVVCREERVEMP